MVTFTIFTETKRIRVSIFIWQRRKLHVSRDLIRKQGEASEREQKSIKIFSSSLIFYDINPNRAH